MRTRMALVVASVFVLVVVLLSTTLGTSPSATSASPQEKCSACVSSPTRSSLTIRYRTASLEFQPRARVVMPQPTDIQTITKTQHARLATFAQAVNTYQLVSYTTAVTAAQESAARQAQEESSESVQPTESMSPTPTTTPTPALSAADEVGVDQLLTDAPAYVISAFNCIADNHESGGDPTAVNPSSGAAGLYQFEVPTWLANGGGQFAPTASEAPVWAQDTVAYWAWQRDGFGPWTGDNSCWE